MPKFGNKLGTFAAEPVLNGIGRCREKLEETARQRGRRNRPVTDLALDNLTNEMRSSRSSSVTISRWTPSRWPVKNGHVESFMVELREECLNVSRVQRSLQGTREDRGLANRVRPPRHRPGPQ